ncbi:N-acetylmuramoyl-L-alanine amidase family protein [Paenibacillus sp. Soil724D2]|uniref:peptidoglycan recognition protein family protein n=1 Tax=Paenibacillus sp. (strain Soil724D2) TaxID=1736392 RepID=UPI0007148C91|nr:N-acetylmuramoyl-L-alanine amidase [Paenibacillus sp. Soil724D2]KRE33443.1 hypothetical protein ASG85_14345 [Paenibacillus sp. Soil724D2]
MLLRDGSRLGQAFVILAILPKGVVNPMTPNTQQSITIHNTGNPEATAKGHIGAITQNNNGTGREASWHFTVDDRYIVQHIDTAFETWNTLAGKAGNATTIAIEICEFADPVRQALAEDNAAALVKYLIAKGIPNVVKQHHDWSGKDCPHTIRARPNGWQDFLNKVNEEEGEMKLSVQEVDYILSVLGKYWHDMDGSKEIQDYTHFVANRVREESGRPKQ